MNLICTITDEDINEEIIELSNPRIRNASRGIVIRNDGKIAVINKVLKNEYKLPGGGSEPDEEAKETFKREVLEETGCGIEIIQELGITEEYKSHDNFKQISHIFVGKVVTDTNMLHLTKKETDEGTIVTWKVPQEALELITNCFDKLIASSYESVYETKFVVLRDKKILEYYLNQIKKS